MTTKLISIVEVEHVAHRLAKELMEWDEPIPEFTTRYPNILEGCLHTPTQTVGGKGAYKGLIGKGAILFYLMIKNHPFQNGNKRVAVASLLYLFLKNKKWLKVDNQEFYNFAKWVAESNPKLRYETIAAISKFLQTYITEV